MQTLLWEYTANFKIKLIKTPTVFLFSNVRKWFGMPHAAQGMESSHANCWQRIGGSHNHEFPSTPQSQPLLGISPSEVTKATTTPEIPQTGILGG